MTTDANSSPGSPAATRTLEGYSRRREPATRSSRSPETPASSAEPAPPETREPRDPEPERDGRAPREAEREPVRPHAPETEADRAAAVADLLRGGSPRHEAAGRGDDEGQGGAEGVAARGEGEGGAGAAERAPDGPDAELGADAQRTGAGDAEGAEGRETPRTLKDAADRLGVEPDRLYDLEVTTGDGETVSLGELKDAWQDRAAAERETAQRSDAIDERETALSRDAQRLGQMVQELARTVGPQRLGQVAQLQEQHAQQVRAQERELMLHVLPELRDAARLDAFREELVEGLGAYGFTARDLDISDHRLVWFARDALRAMRKLKELRAAPDPVPSKPPKARRPRGRGDDGGAKAAAVRRAQGGNEADKLRGVSALLSGGG